MENTDTFIAAAVQASPVFLDLDGSLSKLEDLARSVAGQGAELIVFPEAFIPGYPYWIWNSVLAPEGEAFRTLWEASIDVPGPATDRLGQLAKSIGSVIVVGANERDSSHGRSTLYNAMLTFDRDGRLVRHHRKLVPTYRERTIWGAGDGSGLDVAATKVGRIGGLICWENYMPLARFHQYAQGVQVHVAISVDESTQWVDLMKVIAAEGRVYVVSSCQFLDPEVIANHPLLEGFPDSAGSEKMGQSVIVDPHGTVIAGPEPGKDIILTAEIDPAEVIEGKHSLDVTGHYARPDIFQLSVNTSRQPPYTSNH